jgi:hypothetical protein
MACVGTAANRSLADSPPLKWTHHISFPETQGIRSVVFSHDGNTAYANAFVNVLDVWQVGVHFWPEILGAIAGLATLVALLLVARSLRRPRRVGLPHCPACNYDLSGRVNGP